jgi:hypothetical protein
VAAGGASNLGGQDTVGSLLIHQAMIELQFDYPLMNGQVRGPF